MLTDEELMERYRAGDRAAFLEIFHRYAPLLLRLMQQRISRREDAYDLVQQTFLQVHRAKDDFRTGSPLRPWLLTIAINLKHRHFRRCGRMLETPIEQNLLDELHVGAWQKDALDTGHDVRAALAGLPAEQREVIVLHWLEGLSFEEVALVVGVSLSAVKVRAHRGYTAIRKVFAESPKKQSAALTFPRGSDVGIPRRSH